jgi:hypothetical protein
VRFVNETGAIFLDIVPVLCHIKSMVGGVDMDSKVTASFNQQSLSTWAEWSASISVHRGSIFLRLPQIKGLRPIGRSLKFSNDNEGWAKMREAMERHEKEFQKAKALHKTEAKVRIDHGISLNIPGIGVIEGTKP